MLFLKVYGVFYEIFLPTEVHMSNILCYFFLQTCAV